MIVSSDSPALVALSVCDSLPLLDALSGEVKVPQAVYDKVCIPNKAESQALQAYLEGKVCNALTLIIIEKSLGLI
jgi:uncharacterized protein